MAHLHIFTLTWNGLDKLTKLYHSLIPALGHLDYTWFIKDNGSKDDTVGTVKSWEGNIKIISYKDNQQNFSAGMNYLFANASPPDNDLVMLLNNDIVINDTTSISRMLTLLRDDEVGMAGCRLLYSGTNKLQHAGVVFDSPYKTPFHFRPGQVSDANAAKNRVFQAVTGAVCITKADYYRHTGVNNKSGNPGMDEIYQWCFEDIDLCLTIGRATQKKIVYCGETEIFHEESASLKKNPVNKLFLKHNVQHFLNRWDGKYAYDKSLYLSDPNYNLYRK